MAVTENIKRMLDLIVCPHCRGPLSIAENGASIACASCRHRYSIQDGILVLIAGRATT